MERAHAASVKVFHQVGSVADARQPRRKTARNLRAITVLENIGSEERRRLLRDLASGAPGARETEDARESLERLERKVAKSLWKES